MANDPTFEKIREKLGSIGYEPQAKDFFLLAYSILYRTEVAGAVQLVSASAKVPRAKRHCDQLVNAAKEVVQQFLLAQDEPERAWQLLHAVDKQVVSMWNGEMNHLFDSPFSRYVPDSQAVIAMPKSEEKLVGSIYDITPQDLAERLRKWLDQLSEAYPINADVAGMIAARKQRQEEMIAAQKQREKEEAEEEARIAELIRSHKEEKRQMRLAKEEEERRREREARYNGFRRLVLRVNLAVGAFLAIGIVSGWFTIGDIIGTVFR